MEQRRSTCPGIANGLNVPGLLALAVGAAVGAGLAHWISLPRGAAATVIGSVVGGVIATCLLDARRAAAALPKGVLSGLGLALVACLLYWVDDRRPWAPEPSWSGALNWALAGFFLGPALALLHVALWQRRSGRRPTASHCDVCRRPLLHPALGRKDALSFRPRPSVSCPRCWVRRRRREALLRLPLTLLTALPGLVLVLLNPDNPSGWVFLNLALLGLFCLLLRVLHELAHALAGWLVGLRVFRIHLGHGVSVYDRGRWGLTFDPELAHTGDGWTWVGYPNTRRFRTRHFLLVLAGPLLHALLLALTFWWVSPAILLAQGSEVTRLLLPWPAFAAANLLFLAVNLLPFRSRHSGQELHSDGLQLLSAPFQGEEVARQANAGYFAMEAQESIRRRDFEEMTRWCEEGLRLHPDDPLLSLLLALGVYRQGDIDRARSLWLAWLERPDADPLLRRIALDGVVTVDVHRLLLGVPEHERSALREETDRRTQELLREADGLPPPLVLSFLASRGGALVERGEVDEGAELLRGVLEQTSDPSDRAHAACGLALAALRKGDAERAGRHLTRARAWDATCPFLGPIERLIEG
jgi:hypothetical protein